MFATHQEKLLEASVVDPKASADSSCCEEALILEQSSRLGCSWSNNV